MAESPKRNRRTGHPPKIGNIYVIDFNGMGGGQTGDRPGIIFQNNVGNATSGNVIVYPLTSSPKKGGQPTHVFIPAGECGIERDSTVLCENPVTVPKSRLKRFCGVASQSTLEKIAVASLLSSGALSFLNLEQIESARRKSITLNKVKGKGGEESESPRGAVQS